MKNRSSRCPRPVRILSLAGLLAAACGPGDPAGEEPRSSEPDRPAGQASRTDADQVFAADEAFNQATQDRGIEGWLDFFATDGRMLVNGDEIVGRDAIREAMDPFLASARLEWRPSRAVARAGSDLAYTVGNYRTTLRESPDSVVATGSYVTIWERQRDGSWKVSLDTGSPHPEPRP